jgi:hypothetical protein
VSDRHPTVRDVGERAIAIRDWEPSLSAVLRSAPAAVLARRWRTERSPAGGAAGTVRVMADYRFLTTWEGPRDGTAVGTASRKRAPTSERGMQCRKAGPARSFVRCSALAPTTLKRVVAKACFRGVLLDPLWVR